MNTTGRLFKVSSFGESHGPYIGIMIDGCPAGVEMDLDFIRRELNRRKPGQSEFTTDRQENDAFEVVSGVFNNKTTGAPVVMLIPNLDARPGDYSNLKDVFRPSHADFTYHHKYGNRDYRGGGRSSARVTAGWVAAGALAKLLLRSVGIDIRAFVRQIYNESVPMPYSALDLNKVEESPVRCPHPETSVRMEECIRKAKQEGDSLGGIMGCVVKNVPAGLGEPLFDKLSARIAQAIMSINAVKGIQFGDGFELVSRKGSEVNDAPVVQPDGSIGFGSNHSGGIMGGISNGENIYFEAVFKPVATISKTQTTVNTEGIPVTLEAGGRHDPCVLPRAVPIVEAMTALVLADFWMLKKAYTL